MKKHLKITDIVLDFDGTCTQIPAIYEAFLAQYLAGLNTTVFAQAPVTPADWQQAQQQVRMHSPQAGWTIAGTSASPAVRLNPAAFSCVNAWDKQLKIASTNGLNDGAAAAEHDPR